MGRDVRLYVGAVIAAFGVAMGVVAQETENPLASFFAPVDVPLVSVEVYVYDGDGRPVPGLRVEDFEVLEDGRPVEISHFFAAAGVEALDSEDPATVGERAIAQGPEQDIYLVILFNDTNLSRGRRQAAVDYLSDFLRKDLPKNLKVMLVRYDGGMHVEQSFSEETDEVISALERIKDASSVSRRLDEGRILHDMDVAATGANALVRDTRRAPDYLEASGRALMQDIDSFSDRTVQQVRNSIEDQKQLIRSLSGLNGRKAVLLVTDGVEPRPGHMLYMAWAEAFGDIPAFEFEARRAVLQSFRNDLTSEFNDLTRFANGHRVSFYTLSSMGSGLARASSAERRSLDEQGLAIDQELSEEVMMAYVAGSTGGRSLVNSPSLARQLDEVSVELGSYYSLAFEPSHLGDGKYHRLEVKLKNMDGVGIRHREGYMDVPLSDGIVDRTLAAAVHGFDDNPLGISLATNGAFVPRDDGTLLVPVIITVPIGELVLIPSENEHRGQISIMLTVKDDRGRLSPPQMREYPVPVPNAELASALNQGAGFTLRLAMRPGRQRIAVGVRDDIARTEAVTAIELFVEDTESERKSERQ